MNRMTKMTRAAARSLSPAVRREEGNDLSGTVASPSAVPFISGSLRAAASVQSCHPGRFRVIRPLVVPTRAATLSQRRPSRSPLMADG